MPALTLHLLALTLCTIHLSTSTPITFASNEPLTDAAPAFIDATSPYRTDIGSTHVLLKPCANSASFSEDLPIWNPLAGFPTLISGLQAQITHQISISGALSLIGVNEYFNNNARPSDQVWQWRMIVSGMGKPKPTEEDVQNAVGVLEAQAWRFERRAGEQEEVKELRTVEVVIGRMGVEENESEEGRLATGYVWWGHMYDLEGEFGVKVGDAESNVKAVAVE